MFARQAIRKKIFKIYSKEPIELWFQYDREKLKTHYKFKYINKKEFKTQ